MNMRIFLCSIRFEICFYMHMHAPYTFRVLHMLVSFFEF
jgi:hypothetical protein